MCRRRRLENKVARGRLMVECSLLRLNIAVRLARLFEIKELLIQHELCRFSNNTKLVGQAKVEATERLEVL
jgi:hypothetical protein